MRFYTRFYTENEIFHTVLLSRDCEWNEALSNELNLN